LAIDSRHPRTDPGDPPGGRTRAIAAWLVVAAGATAGLWLLRSTLDKAHIALVFLLIVLGASARHGRLLGLGLAGLCFVAFNYLLLPPYYTLRIADPLDWGVLVAFLITGAVAAQLLHRAQREARTARERAEEVDRLSVLGAETLNAGRAEDAMLPIARVIRTTLRVAVCEILMSDDAGRLTCLARDDAGRVADAPPDHDVLSAVIDGGFVAVRDAGSAWTVAAAPPADLEAILHRHRDCHAILLPLTVRGTGLGLLRLDNTQPLAFDAAAVRFTLALSYYAALGIERILLAADADRVHALQEADRLREALVAGVSHDLRTPLTTIKALACEMRDTGDDRATIIEEEADRLNAMVADLLDMSRLRAGALPVSLEIVAGEEVLASALQRVEGARGERAIQARLPRDGSIPAGRIDFSHTVRALVNLLENALKYSGPGSAVEVELEREQDRLVFAVLDRGPGVMADEARRIFEPFYRPGSLPPDAGRAGLGLAIALHLAEIQGGTVEYAPRPGGGSIFRLILPAADVAHIS
jgi:two-component system, OmpR family, sensor histidine kinase KdpD